MPEVAVDAPASIEIDPPSPAPLSPAVTLMAPLIPATESPVMIATDPLAVPVASGEAEEMLTSPLCWPLPDCIEIAPPLVWPLPAAAHCTTVTTRACARHYVDAATLSCGIMDREFDPARFPGCRCTSGNNKRT